MKILIASSYPPMACGIGKSAEQQAAALRAEGNLVDVLSPAEGDGDFQANLVGGLRPLRLLKYAWAYDAVWIHYAPHFYFNPADKADRLLTSFAFLLCMILAGRKTTMVVHETDYDLNRPAGAGSRRKLDRWWWRLAGRVVFHSELERNAFAAHYGIQASRRPFEVWTHEQHFTRYCEADRAAARRTLGIDPAATLLVSIGFIQPHKGFDRVIDALAQIPDAKHMLFKVVGSVRIDWDEAHRYARRLHAMAERDRRAEVIETYVSDATFDLWIVASDYVVLPYRQIWTSAVAARAQLYDRPLLAADAGALAQQLTQGSLLFSNDEELVLQLKKIADAAS